MTNGELGLITDYIEEMESISSSIKGTLIGTPSYIDGLEGNGGPCGNFVRKIIRNATGQRIRNDTSCINQDGTIIDLGFFTLINSYIELLAISSGIMLGIYNGSRMLHFAIYLRGGQVYGENHGSPLISRITGNGPGLYSKILPSDFSGINFMYDSRECRLYACTGMSLTNLL